MAGAGPTFGVFILTCIFSLVIGYQIKIFLMNMMGIQTDEDTDGGAFQALLTDDERNLCEMLNSTMWWVVISSAVLASALFMVSDSVMVGVLFVTLLTPCLWYFATTRVWPKVKSVDFSKRFAWALKRFE